MCIKHASCHGSVFVTCSFVLLFALTMLKVEFSLLLTLCQYCFMCDPLCIYSFIVLLVITFADSIDQPIVHQLPE